MLAYLALLLGAAAVWGLETPSAPFLDLTVQSQKSIYANFSPPLTDGGSAIHSYKVIELDFFLFMNC